MVELIFLSTVDQLNGLLDCKCWIATYSNGLELQNESHVRESMLLDDEHFILCMSVTVYGGQEVILVRLKVMEAA